MAITREPYPPQAGGIDQNGDPISVVYGTDADESYTTRGGDKFVFMRGGDDFVEVGGAYTNGLYNHDLNVYGGKGNDGINAGIGEVGGDLVYGGPGVDAITVGGNERADDRGYGEAGDDVINSDTQPGEVPSLLYGGKGNDLILPGWNDIGYGGPGRDELFSGEGPQTFAFERGDSLAGPNKRDAVNEFQIGVDKLKIGDGEGAPDFVWVGDRTGQEGSIKSGQAGYYETPLSLVAVWNDDGQRQAVELWRLEEQDLSPSDFIF